MSTMRLDSNSILLNSAKAAKLEKPSMLGWLGLTSGNNKNNNNSNNQNNKKSNNSKSGSNYANGSKTLPLSTGRKKGFLSSLDDDPSIQEKDSAYGRKDGIAHHARSNRLSMAAFPSPEGLELDEKAAIRAQQQQQQQQGQAVKVRLPAHVPRAKEEEWELTKNVSTNLPQFEIHDSSFIPGSEKGKDPSDEKPEATKDGSAAVTAASTEVGGKGRSHLEESVRRSLHPEVTLHESKEYKRYTQQFKSIRFDSVPTKGASLLGANALASQKNGLNAGTTSNAVNATNPAGSIPGSLGGVHQQQQYKDSKGQPNVPAGISVSSSSSTVRPPLLEAQKMQNGGSSTSIMTIATAELNEEEEFYYAASRVGGRPDMRMQVATTTANGTSNGVQSPISPLVISPLSPGSGLASTATTGQLKLLHQQQQLQQDQDAAQTIEDDHYISHYLPEPPILLAPVQTTIKPPSESEMVLYNAHVELPKLTLYTVGQTSLNPYWGASSGTRARYDAYMMWILKGRYGNMTMPSASAAAAASAAASAATAAAGGNGSGSKNGSGANGASAGNGGVFTGASSGAGGTRPRMRRESSSIYPTVGEHNGKADGAESMSGPMGHAGDYKEQRPQMQRLQ
ncbi:hypothetical protein EDD21DRAFT_51601 [Dissophora ornata]|nr:hypothetical protein EDD21DRAFT_51601 [Dissophora ornata]